MFSQQESSLADCLAACELQTELGCCDYGPHSHTDLCTYRRCVQFGPGHCDLKEAPTGGNTAAMCSLTSAPTQSPTPIPSCPIPIEPGYELVGGTVCGNMLIGHPAEVVLTTPLCRPTPTGSSWSFNRPSGVSVRHYIIDDDALAAAEIEPPDAPPTKTGLDEREARVAPVPVPLGCW